MSPSAFDLNLLLVLDAVLAEGSVAKATSRLHVIPSAVSNALARLRVLFGDPLLTRKGRGVVPTPRALELAPVLARTLRDLQDAVRAGTFNPGITTRRFTIALSDVGQGVLLPHIAEELFEQAAVLICRQEHPALASRPTPKVMSTLRHVAVEMAPGQGVLNLMRLGTLPLHVPEMTIATNMYWHERTHADATAAGFRNIVRRAVADARTSAGTSTSRDGRRGKRLRRRQAFLVGPRD